jgi:hypothetical protein
MKVSRWRRGHGGREMHVAAVACEPGAPSCARIVCVTKVLEGSSAMVDMWCSC